MVSIAVKSGNKKRLYTITNAQYDYLIRNRLINDSNTIDEKTFNDLPQLRDVYGATNSMKLDLSRAQKEKVLYGRSLRLKPNQIDSTSRDAFLIKNLSKKNQQLLLTGKRTGRSTKIILTDEDLRGMGFHPF